MLGSCQLEEDGESVHATECLYCIWSKPDIGMVRLQRKLGDTAVTGVFLATPLNVICVHTMYHVLLIEIQAALKYEVDLGTCFLIRETDYKELTIKICGGDDFCFKF